MGFRFAYGNSHSENGWPMVDTDSCEWITVPGTDVRLQIQKGWPLVILRAFAADFNEFVEPLRDADSACWTATNSVSTSNHLSGTALDLNWDSHPFRVQDAGFDGRELPIVRELLDFYEGTVFWGNDWDTPKDAMHFQMGYNTFNNPHTADFIARKIRADGYSTFKRGNNPLPGDPAAILARATGLSLSRATEILPAVRDGLRASECTNQKRIAAWLAQIGHESDGFNATEEYASGEAYEGRVDLGNTQPGDGKRFKGRSWIQITGRHNYGKFSRWCSEKGLVPSPTEFVDNPNKLGLLEWAGIGAAWYWTVARPDINALCDQGAFDTVTYRINGGQNGAVDRRARYQRALQVGGVDLVRLLDTHRQPPTIEELLMADTLYPSVSIYKEPGEGAKYTLAQLIQSIDGMRHRETVEESALRGNLDDIHRVFRVAAGQGEYRDAYTIDYAKRFLVKLKNENPEAFAAYLASKGVA